MVMDGEDKPLRRTTATQVVGGQSTSYCVVIDGSLSSSNGLVSCHTGQFEAIMVMSQVDEAVLPGHGRLESLYCCCRQ